MGRLSSAGMCNLKLESFDRPHSPGMDEIGEILLPQDLVDEILKDVKVDGQSREGGTVKGEIIDAVDVSDGNCHVFRNEMLVCKDGEIQAQVSGFDTGMVVNNGGGDHLDAVGSEEIIDITSSEMNGFQPGGVRNKRVRKSIHRDSSEAALRKEKRKTANRLSAAKSRAIKKAQLEMLESNIMNLKKENLLKQKSLQFLKGIPKESTIQFQLRRTSSL